jgi:hypothetical protein
LLAHGFFPTSGNAVWVVMEAFVRATNHSPWIHNKLQQTLNEILILEGEVAMSRRFRIGNFFVVLHSRLPRLQLVVALLVAVVATAVAPAQVPTQSQKLRLVIIRSKTGATIPKVGQPTPRALTKAQLVQLLKDPNTRVMTQEAIARSQAAHLEAMTKNRATYAQIFRTQPVLLARLAKEQPPALVRSAVVPMKITGGATRSVVLMNRDAMVRDALLTRKLLQNADVQLKTYEWLYREGQAAAGKSTPAAKALKASLGTAATPASLRGRDASQILQATLKLLPGVSSGLAPVLLDQPPPEYIGDPSREEGAGRGGDRTGCNPGARNPNGLYMRCRWPLKWYNTSVKDQQNRGTCPAFAICGAVESLIALEYRRWVNLSEQDLYKHQRLDWFPLPPYYGDGYVPPLSLLQQLVGIYYFPFERDWDYNPSLKRRDDPSTLTYSDSCVDYSGRWCSDTNHQAQAIISIVKEVAGTEEVVTEVCSWIEDPVNVVVGVLTGGEGHWDCKKTYETVTNFVEKTLVYYEADPEGSSGFRVTEFVPFYDPIIGADNGVEMAKYALDVLKPVVFGFEVTPSFQNEATSNGGFVPFRGADEACLGGHAVLATGYIENSKLPQGIPPGSGGGYFIIKNSWGCGWGDQGYGYLPVDWVKRYVNSMSAVMSVGR